MDVKRLAVRRLWLPRTVRHRWATELHEQDFRKRLAAARESDGVEAVQELLHERSADEFFDYEDSEIAFTKTLVLRARDLRVPVPEYPDAHKENE